MKTVWKVGFTEKNMQLPDGDTLSYAESADTTLVPLLLIHGQTGAWQDYAPILAEASKQFHVFALDCHGHGKSSKNPLKYTAKEIAKDFAWFIEHIIGKPVLVSGHSSGGLLAAYLAANYPNWVQGALLEDPPFFSTEQGERWEHSFAYVDTYEPMHRFLNQTQEKDWVLFYLEHAAWGTFVGEKGMGKMRRYAKKYRQKHPGKPLNFFFLPDSINRMFWFIDEYDLKFGEAFYNGSWFDGFDQSKTLSRINCPTILIHTKWSVDKDGILMAAMSGEDAEKAHILMRNSEILHIDSGHNSHGEKPKEFLAALYRLRQKLSP